MTSLRQRMTEDMQVRNLALDTQTSYLRQVSLFARRFNQSPEALGPEEIRAYQVYLTNEKDLSTSSILVAISALRFVYNVSLKKNWNLDDVIPTAKKPQKLPVVMSPEEVLHFLACVASTLHRTILTVCYGAGLRIPEAVHLKPAHIDSQRMVIRVDLGKGQKDRYVMLSPKLLESLRSYWRAMRPKAWLFEGEVPGYPVTTHTVEQACQRTHQVAGIHKPVTPHSFRHASAYYTTFPTLFILKTIGLGQARSGAVYGPRGPLSPVAVRPAMPSPSGRLSTEHTLPHASPVEYVLG
jgi:integrase/recombinase XerD